MMDVTLSNEDRETTIIHLRMSGGSSSVSCWGRSPAGLLLFRRLLLNRGRFIFLLDRRIPSVVHPDPDPTGSEIICKLGSGSVINSGSDSGFQSGSKLSSASN